MKVKIILLSTIILTFGVLISSYVGNTTNKNVPSEIHKNVNSYENNVDSSILSDIILCDGEIFNKYPDFNSVRNKEFAKLLSAMPKTSVKTTYWNEDQPVLNDKMKKFMFDEAKKKNIKDDGLLDFNTRVDGNKLDWSPITILPSNGKFIMLILHNWEKDSELPPSRGYYLCTFNLNGDLLSFIYAYGGEELRKSSLNKKKINEIWGRAYCLNTNKIIIRKAISWNYYLGKDDSYNMDLEVEEIGYIIDETGNIKTDKRKVIFPRTQVKWQDREPVQFDPNNDTIKKLLGEIK